jgi:hypothetical protein
MKVRKSLLSSLFFYSFCCVPVAYSASTGDHWFDDKKIFVVHSKKEESNKVQQNMEPSVTGDLSDADARALSSDPAGQGSAADPAALAKNQVRFTKSAYAAMANENVLYLGAENLGIDSTVIPAVSKVLGTDKKNFILARAILGMNSAGAVAPMIQSLAPDKVTLNGQKDQENPLVQAMPNMPHGTNITNLTLLKHRIPVVTAQVVDATKNAVVTTEATHVTVVTDSANGSSLLQNKTPIKDSDGDDIDTSIVAMSASNQEIFAAVPARGESFDAASPAGDNRGIAVLRPAADDVVVLNNKASKIDLTAYDLSTNLKDVQFAFVDHADTADAIGGAKVGNTAAMFWDDTLERLFIGLNVKRDMTNKAGGVLNLAVGRLEKDPAIPAATTADVLTISPIVANPKKELFYDATKANPNNLDHVVGFYYDHNTFYSPEDGSLAIDMIRSMHTSTGKDYLIVAGGLDYATGGLNNKYICAIPLLGTAVNADGKNPQLVGTLAKPDFSGPPTVMSDMPKFLKRNTSVRFIDSGTFIDFFVQGDSVYYSLFQNGHDISSALGLFQSTALFDHHGIIVSWTAVTRVMGSLERVYGAGLDSRTGEYLFVTETNEIDSTKPFFDPANPNKLAENISSVRLSGWGKTDTVNNLTEVLEALFPQNLGGVHQLIAFERRVPGFKNDSLNVMLAIGLDRVVLIQTGKADSTSLILHPEKNFIATAGATQNVFSFIGEVLSDIGPICTADFARSTKLNEGWLFVGGYAGVAVLRKINGTGFDSAARLDNLEAGAYPGTGYSFKKLEPSNGGLFDHVRKVACLNGFLYVLTDDTLYSVAFAANKFQDAPGVVDLDEQIVINAATIPGATLLDFIMLDGTAGMPDFKALIATTHGLFTITHDGVNYVTQEIQVGGKSLGPVIQMQYISSSNATFAAFGNLYVLAADTAKSLARTKIYRFAVDPTTPVLSVLPIPSNNVTPAGLVVDLGEFRSNFFADGSTILHTRGRHFGDTNYLAAIPTMDFKSSKPLTPQLALTAINTNIGAVVRDSASGALYAPGDWGVRANL